MGDMEELEALVFGGADGVFAAGEEAAVGGRRGVASAHRERKDELQRKGKASRKRAKGPAWEDEDDRDVEVDLLGASRARKLRKEEDESRVSGAEYSQRLRQRFAKMHGKAGWARRTRSRRPAWEDEEEQASDEPSDGEADGAGGADGEPDLEAVLRSNAPLLAGGAEGGLGAPHPVGRLEIHRVRNLNQAAPSKAVVRGLEFHRSGQLALTAGLDKTLRLFQVDGQSNPKVQGVHFADLPITSAAFTTGGGARDEVVCSGRRKHFYVFDLGSGKAARVPRIEGRDDRSLETMIASPCGHYLCFLGNDGYLVLVSAKTRRWIANLRMNSGAHAACFSQDGRQLFATGDEGEVYRWDLRTRACLHRHKDEGSLRGTALAAAPNGRYYAVGSESGVVNVYDMESDAVRRRDAAPAPAKALMGLTTRADVVRFSPDGSLLVTSSFMEKDAVKVVHCPSFTTFANWPTQRTPLGYVGCAAFSPHGGYLSLANDKGKALLYRLPHYSQA